MYLDSDKDPTQLIVAGLRLLVLIATVYWYTTWNSWITGIMYGIVTYKAMVFVLNQYMFHFQNCEGLCPFDEIYWYDDENSLANILGALYFEKFEFEKMRDTLLKNTEHMHKCRSKVVI
jgi:hypothetical protein